MKQESVSHRNSGSDGLAAGAGLIACLLSVLLSPLPLSTPRGAAGAPAPEPPAASAVDALCSVNVKAPMPFLRCDGPAEQFRRLRRAVVDGAGFDFLATCGDMTRGKSSGSSKPGVARDSRHKFGEAFDYNQEDGRLLVVREPAGGRTYWRTYLRCEGQAPGCGPEVELESENAGRVTARVFDFTAAAESMGWARVPAQDGWERAPTKKEFWHYETKGAAEADETPVNSVAGAPGEDVSPFAAPFGILTHLVTPLAP